MSFLPTRLTSLDVVIIPLKSPRLSFSGQNFFDKGLTALLFGDAGAVEFCGAFYYRAYLGVFGIGLLG